MQYGKEMREMSLLQYNILYANVKVQKNMV